VISSTAMPSDRLSKSSLTVASGDQMPFLRVGDRSAGSHLVTAWTGPLRHPRDHLVRAARPPSVRALMPQSE
jgi:hypothetical protein